MEYRKDLGMHVTDFVICVLLKKLQKCIWIRIHFTLIFLIHQD